MGEVVNLNDKRKGAMEHIEEVYVLTQEYVAIAEVASFTVIEPDNDVEMTPKQYTGRSTMEILEEGDQTFFRTLHNICPAGSIIIGSEYPDVPFKAYKFKGEVDIDLAVELGLGVLYLENEWLVYYPEINELLETNLHEMLLIKVYAQLMNPNVIDLKLKEGYPSAKNLIRGIMLLNEEENLKKLEAILF